MEPVAVTKDFNRNVLRFRIPREHPILDARRVQLRADGATGSDFGTRTARCPEPVPRWLELIGSMVTIPSGPAYATAMVAAANHVIAEALACGDDRHAVALRGLAQRAYEEAQARGGGTTALKAGFLKYAGATQRATAARREALLLNTESRHGRHFLIGEVVETRFGVGRLVYHRMEDDMCVVDLGYGRASVPRSELAPVVPPGALDSLAPVLPASVIAGTVRGRPSGTGVTTGSASGSHASVGAGDTHGNAGSSPTTESAARVQELAHAVQAMQHERIGVAPTPLERRCAAALVEKAAASVLASGQPIRATKASLHQLADAYRRRVAARSVPDAKRMLPVPSVWPTGPPPSSTLRSGAQQPLLFRSRRAPRGAPLPADPSVPHQSAGSRLSGHKRSPPSQDDDVGSAGAGEASGNAHAGAGAGASVAAGAGSVGDAGAERSLSVPTKKQRLE